MYVSLILVSPCSSSVLFKQGIAGDTYPLAQAYFVWANTELGNFMTYNSYMNEDTKACDLNVKVIYDLDIKVLYCKYSDFQVGRDLILHDRKYCSRQPWPWAQDLKVELW